MINERQAKPGDPVYAGDKVTLDGLVVQPLAIDDIIFLALNKPVGVVCTAAKNDRRNIVDHVGHHARVFPVGRLDKDSQGLIFLTNSSPLVNRILQARNGHEKEYVVTVNKDITDDFVSDISSGVPMLETVTAPCKVIRQSCNVFSITLTQGLNRQIRRLCKYHNYAVIKLERIRIMHVSLGDLALGRWREFDSAELSTLLRTLKLPVSEGPL